MKVGYFLKYNKKTREGFTILPHREYVAKDLRNFTWDKEAEEAAQHEWTHCGGSDWMYKNRCAITVVVDFDDLGDFEEVGTWEIAVRCEPYFFGTRLYKKDELDD